MFPVPRQPILPLSAGHAAVRSCLLTSLLCSYYLNLADASFTSFLPSPVSSHTATSSSFPFLPFRSRHSLQSIIPLWRCRERASKRNEASITCNFIPPPAPFFLLSPVSSSTTTSDYLWNSTPLFDWNSQFVSCQQESGSIRDLPLVCLAPHHIHITSCPPARCLETVCFCLDSKPRQPQPNDDRYCCPIFPHISDLKTLGSANFANLTTLLLLLRILFSAPTAYDTRFGKELAGCQSVWEANRKQKVYYYSQDWSVSSLFSLLRFALLHFAPTISQSFGITHHCNHCYASAAELLSPDSSVNNRFRGDYNHHQPSVSTINPTRPRHLPLSDSGFIHLPLERITVANHTRILHSGLIVTFC